MEYMQFMRERITELRLAKGIRSERELSRRLGKNEQYIQHITSGRQNMGWDAFFELCRYFDITPQEFFDPDLHCPDRIREAVRAMEKLPEEDIRQLTDIAKKLSRAPARPG